MNKKIIPFEHIVIIGSGKIASKCVDIVLKYFNKKITIIEYEIAMFSPFNKFKKYKNIEIIKNDDRKLLTDYFSSINLNTLIVSANNNYIFKQKLIRKKNILIVNFHNALLPKHRGRNAQMWTIFHKDKYAGVTWHIVNEQIDDGEILIQEKIILDTKITSIELTQKLIELGIEMFDKIIIDILDLSIETTEQQKILYDYNNINKLPNNGYLNLSDSIEDISAFLRAMDFGKIRIVPYPKIVLFGNEYHIISYDIKQNILELNLKSNKKIRIELENEK